MKIISLNGKRYTPKHGKESRASGSGVHGFAGRALAWALIFTLILGLTPMQFAQAASPMQVTFVSGEADACAHEHDALCGYAEGVDCTHDCGDGDCGYGEGIDCDHDCDGDCGMDEDGEPICDHNCGDGSCAFVPASPCDHQHDGDYGYIEAAPCGHVCDDDCFAAPMAAMGTTNATGTVSINSIVGDYDTLVAAYGTSGILPESRYLGGVVFLFTPASGGDSPYYVRTSANGSGTVLLYDDDSTPLGEVSQGTVITLHSVPEGFLRPNFTAEVDFTNDTEFTIINSNNDFMISVITRDISFIKVNQFRGRDGFAAENTSHIVGNAFFTLFLADGDTSTGITATSGGANGATLLQNIMFGEYVIKETTLPANHIGAPFTQILEYTVTVGATSNVHAIPSTGWVNHIAYRHNITSVHFDVHNKHLTNDKRIDAEFTLFAEDLDGNQIQIGTVSHNGLQYLIANTSEVNHPQYSIPYINSTGILSGRYWLEANDNPNYLLWTERMPFVVQSATTNVSVPMNVPTLQINGTGEYTTPTQIAAAITAAFNGGADTVTVTGSFTGATILDLTIPEGKTVIWQANYHGNIGGYVSLIDIRGDGVFEVSGGADIRNSSSLGYAIRVHGSAFLHISGGYIESGGMEVPPVLLRDNSSVFVSGGNVYNVYNSSSNFVISADSAAASAYFIGNRAGWFSGFAFGTNRLFNLEAAPALTAGGTAHNPATPFTGNVVASFPSALTVPAGGLTANGTGVTGDQSGNTFVFSGTFDVSDITLTVTGATLGGITVPTFTTATFRVNAAIPTYTVTYNTNGGDGGSVPTDANSPYENDAFVTVLFTPLPTRDNFTFTGWAATNDATTAAYRVGGTTTFSMGTANVTLYAVWASNACDIVTVTAPGDASHDNSAQTVTANVLHNVSNQEITVTVSTGATWAVYNNIACEEQYRITNDTMTLNPGVNTVYIKVTAADGTTSKIFTVTITRAFNYTAGINPSGTHTFTGAEFGYATQTEQQFTISNTGTGTLTNVTATLGGGGSSDFEIITALSPNFINPPSGTATVGVRPKTGLAANAAAYTDTLIIRWDNDGGTGLTVNLSFTVGAKQLTDAMIGAIAAQPYTGAQITPSITVTDGATPLTAGTDYDITGHGENINVATDGTMTITGKGNYSGAATASFAISRITPVNGTHFTHDTADTRTYDGNPKSVTITPQSPFTGLGTATVTYDDSTTNPANAGTYIVRTAFAQGANFDAHQSMGGFNLGTMTISPATWTGGT